MRKQRKKYYFSVEGDTEKWYLTWLQQLINANPGSTASIKIQCEVDKNPLSYVKSLSIVDPVVVTHFFDYESNDAEHVQQFSTVMDQMKAAEKSGKSVTYQMGYSNYTFDLWMILHKADCNTSFAHRRQYLQPINQAYDEHFQSLAEYKQEDNFNRILKKISLDDVRQAISRSERIEKNNESAGHTLYQYRGFKYFKENPSLSVWKTIKDILTDCGLN